jgi:hypothetical protein
MALRMLPTGCSDHEPLRLAVVGSKHVNYVPYSYMAFLNNDARKTKV